MQYVLLLGLHGYQGHARPRGRCFTAAPTLPRMLPLWLLHSSLPLLSVLGTFRLESLALSPQPFFSVGCVSALALTAGRGASV